MFLFINTVLITTYITTLYVKTWINTGENLKPILKYFS